MPCDIHWSGALMLHIVSRAQIRISLSTTCHTIRLELADEQQHLAAALLVVNIALTGR